MLKTPSHGYLRTALGIDGGALWLLRPHPAELLRDLQAPHPWVARVGADVAAATLASAALWCACAWLAVGLLALTLSALPGRAGRAAQATSRRLLPRTMYRILAGSAGVGVFLAPLAAGAQTSTPPLPAPTMPISAPLANGATTSAAEPTTPNTAPHTTTPTTAPTTAPTAAPSSAAPSSAAPMQPTDLTPAVVVVKPGDSLWSITATQLHTDAAGTATEWPRVYALNRAVIGTDPDLVQPGQRLRYPRPRIRQPNSTHPP